jgi:hypothetical protein
LDKVVSPIDKRRASWDQHFPSVCALVATGVVTLQGPAAFPDRAPAVAVLLSHRRPCPHARRHHTFSTGDAVAAHCMIAPASAFLRQPEGKTASGPIPAPCSAYLHQSRQSLCSYRIGAELKPDASV